jgi:hypothetical protein
MAPTSNVVIGKGQLQEAGGIGFEEAADRSVSESDDGVVIVGLPDRKREQTAGPQHPGELFECRPLVVEEHDSELANERVERAVLEGQRFGRGLLERDAGQLAPVATRVVEHGRAEIGCDDSGG